LDRARRDLGADVAARIAPHDAPQVLGSFVAAAAPWRLDVIETELWPNLILEARRRSVAVAFVSASVSERSTRRLRLLGLAGHRLFGTGVYVLAQTGAHAERFCRLGVPGSRVRVVGDLKAEALPGDRRGGAPFARRPALVFGSARFGEEEVAVRAAEILERHRVEFGDERSRWAAERGVAEDIFAGRCRPVLIVAPRHRGGESRVADALRSRGFQVSVREESHRSRQDLESWIDELSRRSGPRAGVLATRGELVSAYGLAWATLVGGTFAPRGGHTVWEAAARGCPVLAGPHHDQVLAGIEALAARGAGVVLADRDRHLERVLAAWLRDQDLDRRGAAALQAFTASGGAAERALEALGSWGLNP
jgi:3-deoxy-D-manno-octulosonic-acid transferase